MKNCTQSTTTMTIGLDLGDKFSTLHVLDDQGRVLETGKVRTDLEGMEKRFSQCEHARIALEVGTHSPWVSRLLESYGHEVIVANPRRLRLIYENPRKDDKVDAEYLARVARFEPKLLAPIEHRGPETQKNLVTIRIRDALVRARSRLITTLRSSVKSLGGRLSNSSSRSFHYQVVDDIPEVLREAAEPILEVIECLSEKIAEHDRRIEKLCEENYPETQRLEAVKGVGSLTALAFVLILEDPRRFKKSRDVGAYLGLVPRKDKSGEQNPQLGITKAGDGLLRRLLVNCGHHILGPFGEDCDLRRHGEAIAVRGGKTSKKRAVVAVARKLAVLLHRLWISGEQYDPLRNDKKKPPRAKGRMAASVKSPSTH